MEKVEWIEGSSYRYMLLIEAVGFGTVFVIAAIVYSFLNRNIDEILVPFGVIGAILAIGSLYAGFETTPRAIGFATSGISVRFRKSVVPIPWESVGLARTWPMGALGVSVNYPQGVNPSIKPPRPLVIRLTVQQARALLNHSKTRKSIHATNRFLERISES